MSEDDKLSAEDGLIADYFKPVATHPGALGLTDDAAFLTPAPGTDVVLKTDAIIGGVHFFAEDDARDVARKALRVNLSDLAAKGATPLGFLVSLALPKDAGADWLTRFALGLREDAEAFACPLFGGDTVRTPGLVMVSVAMFGSVPTGAMSAATPSARQGWSWCRSPCSAACRPAPWCAAPAPGPAIASSSAAVSAMPRSVSCSARAQSGI